VTDRARRGRAGPVRGTFAEELLDEGAVGTGSGGQSRNRLDVSVGREELAVVEEDHAVAQPAPALLGVVGDDMGVAALRVVDRRAFG
jgi:hypothetical protein